MSAVVAIVGRPNVGKSALFNRIAGRRIAIVHDQPGVTRDRVTAEVEWKGRPFTLVDTGGLGLRPGEKSADVITAAAVEQAEVAIQAADAILLVVNVQDGLVPLDEEVASRLRSWGKPVFVVANKSDTQRFAASAVEFASLGFERILPVSAIHGRGVDSLMTEVLSVLPESEPRSRSASDSESEASPLRLAIVGRPNVGKSSLINALTQSNRVVVSSIPGTTRDAVDVPFEVETEGRRERYLLVDTAGVRKRRRVDNSIEFFSVKRTEEAIARSDIAILVLDAADGILEQDKKIGALITEANRACVVVINKWDLVADAVREAREKTVRERGERRRRPGGPREPMTTLQEFGQWVQEKLFFLDYAPVIFTSAQSGFHLDRLLEAVRFVAAQLKQEIPTAILNRTLHDAVSRRQPISKRGTLLKFYYATQVGQSPPKFLLFLNRTDTFNRAYEKYLVDSLRKAFGYEGCPILLQPRGRPKTIEPVRKEAEARARKSARKGKPPGRAQAREVPKSRNRPRSRSNSR